jgi:PilZ domain
MHLLSRHGVSLEDGFMLARSFRNLTPATNAPASVAPSGVRAANTEAFAGGRGSSGDCVRAEKRGAGRIRTSGLRCAQGQVTDISSTGCRLSAGRRTDLQSGASIRIDLSAEGVSLSVPARVAWVRVTADCTFHAGVAFCELTTAQKRTLSEIVRSVQSTDGLSRGWSPM